LERNRLQSSLRLLSKLPKIAVAEGESIKSERVSTALGDLKN
jgi:hypothetical protein